MATRRISLGEFLVATEGAALFRHLLDCTDDFAASRLAAVRQLVAELDSPRLSGALEVPEMTVSDGYAAWSASYDTMANALIRAEEPLVAAATSDLEPGRALDAACGTGRHAAWLSAAGHAITGVDTTEAMLAIARRKVPTADFKQGDLESLPLDDASFDFAICGLALTHLADPTEAIAELARVVRPGGSIVLTDAHPTFVALQGQALFPTPEGMAFVRNFPHPHSSYLRAFRTAGLSVVDCLESPMEANFGEGLFTEAEEAAAALWDGVPVALVWSLQN